MKLIIQIPCLNEEEVLPVTLKDLPTQIDGIDCIETLIIDDGSTDNTIAVAKECGVHHIVRFTKNKGLARAFSAGTEECLRQGADIVVNTDADNQYYGPDIAKLVVPILEGRADIVVGNRQTDTIPHFSFFKKKLQRVGSWIVRKLSGVDIPDAPSGFRAFTREAVLRLNIVTKFSYTLESLIQAGNKGLAVTHVPIKTNKVLRESRLFTSISDFIKRSGSTVVRVYATHEPLKIFFLAGGFFGVAGLGMGVRFVYYYYIGQGGGHIQSVVFSSMLIIIGVFLFFIGLIADLISVNRRLIETVMYKVKKIELENIETKSKK